jgi:hypothetical protein
LRKIINVPNITIITNIPGTFDFETSGVKAIFPILPKLPLFRYTSSHETSIYFLLIILLLLFLDTFSFVRKIINVPNITIITIIPYASEFEN